VSQAKSDLRSFIEQVDRLGELRVARGANPDLEIGAITDLAQRRRDGPMVLFEDIVGADPGQRILVNAMGSRRRSAMVLGLPTDLEYPDLVPLWRQRIKSIEPIKAREVGDGPVLENVRRGDQIDLTSFPVPRWHERDGGRYIGTGVIDIIRDPDSDWVNLGSYRVMLQGPRALTIYISPGKHGRLLREKYFARGERMPVAIAFGQDPLLLMVGGNELPHGVSEYDYAGGIRGEPIEILPGPVTGLPIPASAEIVVEGYLTPDETAVEGPFAEWTGYYAGEPHPEPLVQVEALYYRNDPILLGSLPAKPPAEFTTYRALMRSALLWDQLDAMGIPEVTGVWCHEPGGTRLFVAVSIRQRYAGHARQVGHAVVSCQAGAYTGRYVVVVDDDVDVTDLDDVIWAMCTRSEPSESIDLVSRAWSTPLDPRISPERRAKGDLTNYRLIVDATRPYEWRDRFSLVADWSPEMKRHLKEKWEALILGEARQQPVAEVAR
jgi:4-hydroxy-3-polyprenylbenzoate decarboxylase